MIIIFILAKIIMLSQLSRCKQKRQKQNIYIIYYLLFCQVRSMFAVLEKEVRRRCWCQERRRLIIYVKYLYNFSCKVALQYSLFHPSKYECTRNESGALFFNKKEELSLKLCDIIIGAKPFKYNLIHNKCWNEWLKVLWECIFET